MTAIQRFPEEVLQIIFKSLNRYDVLQCQKVCHSWYRPAHVILLQDIILETVADFKRFETSIKHNPNSYYLNAVQTVTLGIPESSNCSDINEITKDLLELIVRFPHLKSVDIYGDTCKDPPVQLKDVNKEAIAKSCPELERINIQAKIDDKGNYFDLLYSLRNTLTFMRFSEELQPTEEERYLAHFPHLHTINGTIGDTSEFVDLLTLVDNVPALKDISLKHEPEHETFVEEYLFGKLQEDKDLIIEKLSKITALNSDLEASSFCVNITAFILRYLKGLKSLALRSSFNTDWDDQRHDLYCRLLEYARTFEKFSMSLDVLNLEGLSKCLGPALLMLESYNTNKHKQTDVEIALWDDSYNRFSKENDLNIRMTQDCDTIKLNVRLEIGVLTKSKEILDIFETVSSLDRINSFVFDVVRLSQIHEKYTSVYDDAFNKITRRMSSLKEMVLDIPTPLGEKLQVNNSVTSLTLRDIFFANGELELKKYISLFPKLEDLQLFYFCGIWQKDLHEFQLNLGSYDLRKLTIDLTNVKKKMTNYAKDAFIVIEFKSFSDSKRRLFRTETNLVGTTEINDASLEGLVLGKDYIGVHVTINSLQCFDIFTLRRKRVGLSSANYFQYYDTREPGDLRYVNLFNNKLVQV